MLLRRWHTPLDSTHWIAYLLQLRAQTEPGRGTKECGSGGPSRNLQPFSSLDTIPRHGGSRGQATAHILCLRSKTVFDDRHFRYSTVSKHHTRAHAPSFQRFVNLRVHGEWCYVSVYFFRPSFTSCKSMRTFSMGTYCARPSDTDSIVSMVGGPSDSKLLFPDPTRRFCWLHKSPDTLRHGGLPPMKCICLA